MKLWISENNTQLGDMEEGVYQEKQKCINKIEYRTNRCTHYLRLILLLQVILFFGWGYMILQSLHGKMENESPNITLRDYPSIIESEIQETHASTDTPVIFVKPEIIIDKINNLLEDIKSSKDHNLMQNEAIVTNVPNTMGTNTQIFNVRSDKNETVTISVISSSVQTLLSKNFIKDVKVTMNPIPQKIFSPQKVEYADNVNTDKDEKFVRDTQFFEKLLNMSKAINEEKFKSKNDITEDVNLLTSESQENHADMSNKLKNLELNVATILYPENFLDQTANVDLRNTFQDPKEEFSDLTKYAPQDVRDENSSLFDKINERANAYLKLGFIVCPPHKFHEFSDMPIKDSATDSSISQSSLTQEISENGSSDNTNERNEGKHEKNEDISSLSDILLSKNHDYFDISMVTEQNVEEQSSSESIAKIKEDEKYQSMENIKNSYKSPFLQPTVQDSVESSTSNDKFEWFNMPPGFVNLGLEDISEDTSKSSEIRSLLLKDTYENMDVDDIIPGGQCEITVQQGIFAVKCPGIKTNEEWMFVSPKIPAIDVPKVTSLKDLFDAYFHTVCDEDANKEFKVENIFNENSDKEVTTSRDSASKIINEIELQESNTNVKIFNTLLDLSDAATIDPFDNEERIEDHPFYDSSFYDYLFDPAYDSFHDSNEEEIKQVTTTTSPISDEFDSSTVDSNKEQNPILDISGTQQQEQLKINKDYSIFDNIEISSENPEPFYASEKMLITLFKNELSNIIMQYPPTSFYENSYRKNICSIFRNIRINSQLWYEQYVVFKGFLEAVAKSIYSHNMNDSSYRKKRMIDDLIWQQDQVSNTVEDNKDVDLLENLRKMLQKLEILALHIDRLHERYLLHNRLDDDYASHEFPIETEERRAYTSRILYEK